MKVTCLLQIVIITFFNTTKDSSEPSIMIKGCFKINIFVRIVPVILISHYGVNNC